jgi:transposase
MPQKRYVGGFSPAERVQEVIPVKKNRPYQATHVKQVREAELVRNREGLECHVGLDCSKHEVLVVVRWGNGSFERPWRVRLQEKELPVLIAKLKELRKGREVRIALEPTGTYCDPVRQALDQAGFKVYRVNPKASHDFAEIFDGVPSQHDGKDAACVAELSAIHKATEWPWSTTSQELRQEIEWMDNHQQILTRWLGQLEAELGRYWPELNSLLDLSSSTLVWLLAHYGGPEGVRRDGEVKLRLQKKGGRRLSTDKIERIVTSAFDTIGKKQSAADILQVKRYAEEAIRARREIQKSRKRLQQLTKDHPGVQRLAKIVGPNTASVCWAHLGDPANYHSARAYLKAYGLNLKERSSGRYEGQLKITKRGPSRPRRWLYFAAMRYAQDPWIRPWFEIKKQRGKGYACRALVALMRKIVLAMYQVSVKDEVFEIQALLPGAKKYQPKRNGKRQEVEARG